MNGTGKTTTVAKIGAYLKGQGFTVVIGAGDTDRAGAIEQIGVHAGRLGIKVIQHQEGADPSAVLFDTVQYASSHKIDVVLADTAGRFHTKANLMNQLDKIKRVMKPDLVVYVDEAVAGNDAVTRASEFDRTIGADAVVLTKADMDSRGRCSHLDRPHDRKTAHVHRHRAGIYRYHPVRAGKSGRRTAGGRCLMLDGLSSSLKDALKKLAGRTVVDRAAVDELVKDLQRALISADVNVRLVMEALEGDPDPVSRRNPRRA